MIKTSGNLFEQQRIVKTRDPVSSYAAAERVTKSNLQSSMHAKIVAVLGSREDYSEDTYGWTAKEIAEAISFKEGRHYMLIYHAVARRLNELIASGDIEVAFTRRSKVGDNGSEVQAYRKAKK